MVVLSLGDLLLSSGGNKGGSLEKETLIFPSCLLHRRKKEESICYYRCSRISLEGGVGSKTRGC